ncbi:MAG: DinB family protein [Pirellulaceae bacterium]
MSTVPAMIADAASMGPLYAKRLLGGIPEDRFARMSSPGGSQIQANHPAFILGHLCLYPQRVLEFLGQDPGVAKAPENYDAIFSKTAQCQDDSDGSIYPSADELTAFMEQSYSAAIDALRNCTDEQLAAENPVDNPMRKICPTLGSLLTFYLTSHFMTHLGQLSTWRRMEGLPPA